MGLRVSVGQPNRSPQVLEGYVGCSVDETPNGQMMVSLGDGMGMTGGSPGGKGRGRLHCPSGGRSLNRSGTGTTSLPQSMKGAR